MTRTEIKAVALRMDPHRTKHTQPSARQATSFHFRESLSSLSSHMHVHAWILRLQGHIYASITCMRSHATIFKPTAHPTCDACTVRQTLKGVPVTALRLSAAERPRCDRRCCSRHRHRGDSRGISEDNSLQEVPSVSFAHENRTFTITVNLKDGIVEHSATSSHTAPR